MVGDEVRGGAPSDDAALVHDHQPIAELLGLVHVVGRDDERDAFALEPVQPIPQEVASLGVEAGRRLVEQDDVGLVDERAGDREPPAHAARQALDALVAFSTSCAKSSRSAHRSRDLAALEPEVAPVDEEVLADRQVLVERVVLGHDAEARADGRAVVGGIEAEDPQRAAARRRHGGDHPHGRALAGAVRAEEAERLARPTAKSMPSTATKSP